jgi:hypothetical protein
LGSAAVIVLGSTAFSHAQTSTAQNDKGVQMVGCIERENDYRKAHNLGTSFSPSAQFVIVDASVAPASGVPRPSDVKREKPYPTPSAAGETCAEQGSGQVYRISGHRESELKAFVGHRLEITGTLQHGTAAEAASGSTPSDKLPSEVEMASFREVMHAAPRTAAAPAPEVRTPEPATPAPQTMASAAPRTHRALPRTASPLALVGLIGLVSLGAGSALWLTQRHS